MHLLVHQYDRTIRIVPLDDIAAYESEFMRVYGPFLDKKRWHVFYNADDVIDRLVSDIGFKKFKGCGKLEEIAAQKIYKIPVNAPMDFFSDTFLPWLKTKVDEYIEDADDDVDDRYIDLDIGNLPTDVKEFVDVKFEEVATKYCLIGCQKVEESDLYVVNEDHLKALFMAYAKNNKSKFWPYHEDYTCLCYKEGEDGSFVPCSGFPDESKGKLYKCFKTIGGRYYPCVSEDKRCTIYRCYKDETGNLVPCENKEEDELPDVFYECYRSVRDEYYIMSVIVNSKPCDILKIGQVPSGRGITLNRDVLTNDDIERIIEHFYTKKEAFEKAMGKYVSRLDDNLHIESFGGLCYATLEEAFSEVFLNVWDLVHKYEVEHDKTYNVREYDDSDMKKIAELNKDTSKEYAFYMDLVTYKICCFDFEVKHLCEFKKLGAAKFKSAVVKQIVDSFILKNETDLHTVKELSTMTEHIASFFPDLKLQSPTNETSKEEETNKESSKEIVSDQVNQLPVFESTRVSRRNANQQLRSDPAIECVQVSIWNQATIPIETPRNPFELKGCETHGYVLPNESDKKSLKHRF